MSYVRSVVTGALVVSACACIGALYQQASAEIAKPIARCITGFSTSTVTQDSYFCNSKPVACGRGYELSGDLKVDGNKFVYYCRKITPPAR